MKASVQRFACTQCGKCCNRSPEVQLSEAATLADVFVFRLMFRLYCLPCALADYAELSNAPASAGPAFYQKKRLLAAYAARKYPTKIRRDGRAIECTKYLTVSALALDTSPGVCSALSANRCSIYERRPLACRTVPFHYSRAEALAESDLKAFVETPGYACDTGETADIVLEGGRIVDAGAQQARAQAASLAERDRGWREAIVRRMKGGSSANAPLPRLQEVEARAAIGAMTTSMRVAWQIAADSGLIGADDVKTLIGTQLATINRDLAAGRCTQDARATLADMRAEYRLHLNNDHYALAVNE